MEEKIFMARVAEQAERFDDMVDFLKPILKEKGGDFSVEERNLFQLALKISLVGREPPLEQLQLLSKIQSIPNSVDHCQTTS